MNRRKFFSVLTAGSVGAFLLPANIGKLFAQDTADKKPETNIADALKHPRTSTSMPGKHPSSVVKVYHENCLSDNHSDQEAAYEMITNGMLALTGEESIKKAWSNFVQPDEIIGLKLNPVAGKMLSTSHEVVKATIKHLEEAGIPRGNIMLWDRREFQLHEAGFTEENYPGIKIRGTEIKDKEDSFYNKDGILYGEEMIDKDWYYWADVEGKYDEHTLPYMVNEGKYSYFSKICTKEVDKIINIPILKNAGSSITLCLKNLGYGVISNTGRLHEKLWGETSAEVCAFPPVRDKVVLNIVDGIKGCFNGGPAANPQFITEYKTMLFGSDAVAVDRVGYEIILAKRIEEKIQEADKPKSRQFMEYANELGLGESDIEKIKLKEIKLA
ncbi:MAG: DUF362 domain-containing protein [Bacteroidales bacterium]|nr:DUF362 domain-containing protein [Bacteroidales bacterium]